MTPPPSGLENFVPELQTALQKTAAYRQKLRPTQQIFKTVWGISTLWFVGWALLLIFDVETALKGWVSVVMICLFLIMFAMLWLLMHTRRQLKTHKQNSQIVYYQFLANNFPDIIFLNHTDCSLWANQTHLVKLQEDLSMGEFAIRFELETKDADIPVVGTFYKAFNQQRKTYRHGIFFRFQLQKTYQNNLILFSIRNTEQYFDNVSLNRLALGENQPKRLVKRHDDLVAHAKVDIFNQHFLVAGRNPNWLEDYIDEPVVDFLIDLDKDFPDGLRLELDNQQLTAFVPFDTQSIFSIKNTQINFEPSALFAETETQLAQIQALAGRLLQLSRLL